MIVARSVMRSINALHSRALGITVVHSEKGDFDNAVWPTRDA